MINQSIADAESDKGLERAISRLGHAGHILYGPYAVVDPGDWVVTFEVELADAGDASAHDVVCVLDAVGDYGKTELGRLDLTRASLEEQKIYLLPISVPQSMYLEYRVWSSGKSIIKVNKFRRIFNNNILGRDDLRNDLEFPLSPTSSSFFNENEHYFRHLHNSGALIKISEADGVRVVIDDVIFNANIRDDVNFVGEIFFERAYNISIESPLFVIDVGLNVGLASLQFASRPYVKKVYSFEPFEETYSRAQSNLKLNPKLAQKIVASNSGLGNGSRVQTVIVPASSDSGSRNLFSAESGTPVQLEIQDASEIFEKIIAEAEAAGAKILAKIDCEGSEYDIFESLERSGVLGKVWGFVVEWHGGQLNRSYKTLQKPLKDMGYVIIDRSPRVGEVSGQGVFYAFRAS